MPRVLLHAKGMSTFFAHPSHMPCPECGASVACSATEAHACDPERRLDFIMFQLRDEVAVFDSAYRAFLGSPEGRFAEWLARRQRASGR